MIEVAAGHSCMVKTSTYPRSPISIVPRLANNPTCWVLLPSSTPEVLLDSLWMPVYMYPLLSLLLSNKEGFCNLSSVSHLSKL